MIVGREDVRESRDQAARALAAPARREKRGGIHLHHPAQGAPPRHRLDRTAAVPLRMRQHRHEAQPDDVREGMADRRRRDQAGKLTRM